MNESQLNFPVQLALIDHEVNGEHIHQRPMDGYINATEMCKAAEKQWKHYNENASTKAFFKELSSVVGIPTTELIQTIQGGKPELQGTWIHPKVAINLGQWLSPKFAVWVTHCITEWVEGRSRGDMPPHVKRYIQNKGKIPPTQFSMLNEVYLDLFAPIEDAGIKIPIRMTPDISTGRMFSDYLRKNGFDPDSMQRYSHEYPDGRVVQARLYPIELLSDFKIWFQNEWLPKRARNYFQERLPEVIPHIQHLLGQNSGAGRPPRTIEGIDDSSENVAKAIMQTAPKEDWDYKE